MVSTFYPVKKVRELFGSIPEFQKACGFEIKDKKSVTRMMSKDDIIAKALELHPQGPMPTSTINELSRQGRFINQKTVIKYFGALAAFHEACGFKPTRKTPKKKHPH